MQHITIWWVCGLQGKSNPVWGLWYTNLKNNIHRWTNWLYEIFQTAIRPLINQCVYLYLRGIWICRSPREISHADRWWRRQLLPPCAWQTPETEPQYPAPDEIHWFSSIHNTVFQRKEPWNPFPHTVHTYTNVHKWHRNLIEL